jgi:hypothetical protein
LKRWPFSPFLRQLVMLAFVLILLPLLVLAWQAWQSLNALSAQAAHINRTTLVDARRSEAMTMPRWRWSAAIASTACWTIRRWKRSIRISANATARCWTRTPACCRTKSSGRRCVRI